MITAGGHAQAGRTIIRPVELAANFHGVGAVAITRLRAAMAEPGPGCKGE